METNDCISESMTISLSHWSFEEKRKVPQPKVTYCSYLKDILQAQDQ
jgi:hypothetical protein